MISSAVLMAMAVATSVMSVSAAPEHAKRYRNNANDISSRSGDSFAGLSSPIAPTEDPAQEVVIYEETYPYPAAEYQPNDYYPQHYNYQYHQQPGGTKADRAEDRIFFTGGFGILDPHALQATVTPPSSSSSSRKRRQKRAISPRLFADADNFNPAVLAGIVAFMIGVVFIGGIALKIYAVQQLFQAKLDFIENAIDAKQALITPNLERLIEAKLGIKVFVLEGILGLLNAQRDLTGGLGGEVANIESDLGQFAGVAKFLCELVEANSGIDCP